MFEPLDVQSFTVCCEHQCRCSQSHINELYQYECALIKQRLSVLSEDLQFEKSDFNVG